MTRSKSCRSLRPSSGTSRRSRHRPSRSSSSKARAPRCRQPPICAASHGPRASAASWPPPSPWPLLRSGLPSGSVRSVPLLPPCNACRKPRSSRQSGGLPSCPMIPVSRRCRTSAMPASTCRCGYPGRSRYWSSPPCCRWPPSRWPARYPTGCCGHGPGAAACWCWATSIQS